MQEKQGGWQVVVRKMVFLCLIISLGFFYWIKSSSALSDSIVINEIKIGESGQAKHEFVELFNNSDQAIDISGYSLKKKTSSGKESNLVSKTKFIGTIPASGYFLITHPDFREEYQADLTYSGSSYSISSNNTILFYNNEDELVDKVGYDEASDYENAPAVGPDNNWSIVREPDGQDTDDNNLDFELIENPTPQNSSSTGTVIPDPVCGNGALEQGEECDDGNLVDDDGCSADCAIEEQGETGEPGGNDIISTTTVNEVEESVATSPKKQFIKLGEVCINELVSLQNH